MLRKSYHSLFTLMLLFSGYLCHGKSIQFTVSDVLNHPWSTQLMHKTVDISAENEGVFFPGKCSLLKNGQEIPMQLDNIVCYPDGSIKQTDIWFETAVNPKETVKFEFSTTPSNVQDQTDLYCKQSDKETEIGNSKLAIKLITDMQKTSANLPGPIVSIKSGTEWFGGSQLTPALKSLKDHPGIILDLPKQPTEKLQSVSTRLLAKGPIFYRYKINYCFDNYGFYSVTVMIRKDENLIHIDESYKKAGALVVDFGNFKPAECAYIVSNRSSVTVNKIDYSKDKELGILVGWEGYFDGFAPAFMLNTDKQTIGLISTNADWLPFPYNQGIHINETTKSLQLQASLEDGQRHWAITFSPKADFFKSAEEQHEKLVSEQPAKGKKKKAVLSVDQLACKNFYLWWWQHIGISMDKVLNWQLTWDGMDDIEFPHLFFDKAELPQIRKTLQASPIVKKFMTKILSQKPEKTRFFSDAATAYFYSGDDKWLSVLKDPQKQYVNTIPETFINKAGIWEDRRANFLQITDEFLKRFVGLELLFASGKISKEEQHELLVKMAFMEYLTNDWMFWPHIEAFSPVTEKYYPGYINGTPNMKICYLVYRGLMAAFLKGHPESKKWFKRSLDEFNDIVSDSVAPSGVHLESPFYSSRDTMRFGPYWNALKRAGAIKDNPEMVDWEQRLKNCYSYMGDMLTIPDPRLKNKIRAYHPIGRSSSGVIDPTIMISADPFGDNDIEFKQKQRWLWESQGKPAPDVMGTGGGRDMILTLLAFSKLMDVKPSETTPLKSKRLEGMGLVGRSQVETPYESNILFRQDPFSWNLYEGNNGAVYLWAKGAPLSIRFGAYWNHDPWLMSIPFGNRLIFDKGKAPEWTDAIGKITDYSIMPGLADYATSITNDEDWQRDILFVKDDSKSDPIFLLVRDDTFRKDSGSAIHWWIMSKDVQPDGFTGKGVVPGKGYTDEEWIKNMGKNWKDAPKLTGQLQQFKTHFGVDLDLYIASPTNPKIITDAAGVKGRQPYCQNPEIQEYQQLVRIEQGEGKSYLTLFAPRWPDQKTPTFKTIADGKGVSVDTDSQQNRIFLADKVISYKDSLVNFNAKAGFARVDKDLRLMVVNGSISCHDTTLTCEKGKAGLMIADQTIKVYCSPDSSVDLKLAENYKSYPIKYLPCE